MTEVIISMPGHRHKCLIRLYFRLVIHLVCLVVYFLVIGYALYLWYLFFISDIEDPHFWNVIYYTPFYVTNWNFFVVLCFYYGFIIYATFILNTGAIFPKSKWFSLFTLTRWNFTFQTIFLTMSLAYDIMEWLDHHQTNIGKELKYYRDIVFSGLVLPVTVFISTFFWTIYWIDRELVFPKVYDQLVPWWFNHCVHTNILIVIGIETLLQSRRYPANLNVELSLTGAVGVIYAIVYYAIYFLVHRWLYGVFGIMTWWQVCLFQVLIWAYMFLAYWLQFPINRIFHKEESDLNEEHNTQKPRTLNGSLVNYWDSKLRTSSEANTRL